MSKLSKRKVIADSRDVRLTLEVDTAFFDSRIRPDLTMCWIVIGRRLFTNILLIIYIAKLITPMGTCTKVTKCLWKSSIYGCSEKISEHKIFKFEAWPLKYHDGNFVQPCNSGLLFSASYPGNTKLSAWVISRTTQLSYEFHIAFETPLMQRGCMMLWRSEHSCKSLICLKYLARPPY
jgi:hypothetical protein